MGGTRKIEKTMNSEIYRVPLFGLALILVAGCEPSYGDPPGIGTPEKDVGIAQDMGVVEQNDATGTTYKWNCTEAEDRRVCTKEDQDLGLPVGGNNWRCNRYSVNDVLTWICYGEAAAAPAGDGWICELAVGETAVWKCIRPEGPGDHPPGEGWWACVKGSEFGGTLCEAVDQAPEPSSAVPKSDNTCRPGELRWCDGLQYCGWGQVTCDQSGTWPTKEVNGQQMLDCMELDSGRRPNTVCACYHFYYNPDCCERPDCMVPEGRDGQLCGKSGGGLCSYCNPQNPECTETDAQCVVTDQSETYCGQQCSNNNPCPTGYKCMELKLSSGSTYQCVPEDLSCYY